MSRIVSIDTIKPISDTAEKPAWKTELANLLRDPDELCDLLQLEAKQRMAVKAACELFPLRIPRPYLQRIEPGNLHDPLLQQVLPQGQELALIAGFSADPLDEAEFTPLPGLLHKYRSRVLIVLNGSCAIHCRYCFRRHFPYQEHQINADHWQQILEYIVADSRINEVIFSGGDPLTCTDKLLSRYATDLSGIEHIKTLRLHTRLPIMIPQRINETCLLWMKQTRLQIVMVIHCNHANELDEPVGEALRSLTSAGVMLLNQSVLLRGINDDVESLENLSRQLFTYQVLPYYLFLLDEVQGAAHFDVSREAAIALHEALKARVAGYLVPRLAKEIANETSKSLIN